MAAVVAMVCCLSSRRLYGIVDRRVVSRDSCRCGSVRGCRRRSSGLGCVFVSVFEDFFDGGVLGDESEDFHFGAASGACQRVDLVDAIDKLGPSFI